ncbi:lactonase family protein [Sporolactobacillus pectinivorans]|uniref:lactonase family protein n=1 Tax=Sporolactobacillus pectinivorans TaxID=1591408 RepID=UPI000C260681|nr:lactonase family protein [Sporolactobacillus pectinivorans]
MGLHRGYIGTYTKGESEGIYSFTLDTEKKALSLEGLAAKLGNPTYLAVSGDNHHLYSVMKRGSMGGIAAFSIDSGGQLNELGDQVSEGAPPCYVSTDQNNRLVLSANYHRGTVDLYPVSGASGLTHVSDTDRHEGSGGDPGRQEGPHVHFADFSPDGKLIIAIDLGTDQLTTYKEGGGKLIKEDVLSFAPGTGPRHIIFHPTAPYAYVMSELSSEVIVLYFDTSTGRFSIVQTISALPDDFHGHSQGSAVKISSDGRFVYAANRGADSIAVFRTESGAGRLSLVEQVSTCGNWPRDFELDPSGQFLVTANQNSGNLVLFERDAATGRLEKLNSSLSVPDPVCIKFLYVND